MRQTGSNSQFEKDRRHLLHPFTSFPDFQETGSRFFEGGEGSHVLGADGRSYLDGVGGLWCVNIGYGHEEMVHAIADQVRRLPYYNTFGDMSSGPAADLAALVAELAPGNLDHVFFSTGGSTAVDTAVRIAHYYFQAQGRPEKTKVIARENGYHGSTLLAASMTGIRRNHKRFHTLATGPDPLVHHVSGPNLYRPLNNLAPQAYCDALIDELEETIAGLGADQIACFIAEPIMGAGGILMAPDGYHARALDVCRRNDILYISDEVVTGFGRLGHMFASEPVFDIVPDMIVCAKGITSGYIPLGATIFSDRIYDGIANAPTGAGMFTHGYTYSAHPVACAAGLKNIEIMERLELCAHASRMGLLFHERLRTLGRLDMVGDVRGFGLMAGVEIVADKATKTPFAPEIGVTKKIVADAYARGVIIRPAGDVLVMSPPLIIEEHEIDTLVTVLGDSIEAFAAPTR